MKILTNDQIRKAENEFIKENSSSNLELAKSSAEAFCESFLNKYEIKLPVYVFCGLGGNGLDGLFIASYLQEKKLKVEILIINYKNIANKDFEKTVSYIKLKKKIKITTLNAISDLPNFPSEAVVIDAILGRGGRKVIKDSLIGEVCQFLNTKSYPVFAVDQPTGLCEELTENNVVLQCYHTFCFSRPQKEFFLQHTSYFVGELTILQIGIQQKYFGKKKTDYETIDKLKVGNILASKPRESFSHKFDYGKVLLIAGDDYAGAGLLASKAIMRSGAGLGYTYISKKYHASLYSFSPETIILDSLEEVDLNEFNSIAIGSGLKPNPKNIELLEYVLTNLNVNSKLVLDAGAIRMLAKKPDLLEFLPPKTIITPHKGEFKSIAGNWLNESELLDTIKGYTSINDLIVVYKRRFSIISYLDSKNSKVKLFFNLTGNPGLATAGTGDVLTGIIAGLIAQGFSNLESAIVGTYIHGLAGDLIVEENSQQSLIASDLLNYIGKAFSEVT